MTHIHNYLSHYTHNAQLHTYVATMAFVLVLTLSMIYCMLLAYAYGSVPRDDELHKTDTTSLLVYLINSMPVSWLMGHKDPVDVDYISFCCRSVFNKCQVKCHLDTLNFSRENFYSLTEIYENHRNFQGQKLFAYEIGAKYFVLIIISMYVCMYV